MEASQHIPVEIITHILECSTSKATLASAALCSRPWYDIAVPHLYRHVDIDNHHRHARHRRPYLRTLAVLFLSKAAIAIHVRHFSVRPAFDDWPLARYSPSSPSESSEDDSEPEIGLPNEIQAAIASSSEDDEERTTWLEEADCSDGFLAIFLPVLPNLETLDLALPHSPLCMDRMLWRHERAQKLGSAFTNLKSVLFTFCESEYGGPMFAGIFAIPSIEAIYLHGIGSERGVDDRLLQLRERSNLTHLELRDCKFEPKTIRRLLRIPKALKSFILNGQRSYNTFSSIAIREGLEYHKDSLEELRLDYTDGNGNWTGENDDEKPPITTLKYCPQLKRIKISPIFIFGVDALSEVAEEADRDEMILEFLPEEIETLQLIRCGASKNMTRILKALEHVLVMKDAQVPHLNEIVVEINPQKVDQHAEELARILSLADEIGMKMRVVNHSAYIKREDLGEMNETKWGFNEDIKWRAHQNCFETGCR